MNYDEIKRIVDELIPQFGVNCEAVTKIDAEYDPETGFSSNEKLTSGKVVVTNIDMRYNGQNNLIEAGDQVLLATASLDLQIGSICTVNGVNYQVIAPNPIKPANTVLLYKAQVRMI